VRGHYAAKVLERGKNHLGAKGRVGQKKIETDSGPGRLDGTRKGAAIKKRRTNP